MITTRQEGLTIFVEALAKTLIHKGVFEKTELVKQLEHIRDQKDRIPAEQTAYAAEIDMLITRVHNL
jgi:hypothetical protein